MNERLASYLTLKAQSKTYSKMYAQVCRLALFADRVSGGGRFGRRDLHKVQRIPLITPEYTSESYLSGMPFIGYLLGIGLELARFCWNARVCWEALCREPSEAMWRWLLECLQQMNAEAADQFGPTLADGLDCLGWLSHTCSLDSLSAYICHLPKSRGEEQYSTLLWKAALGAEDTAEREHLKQQLHGLGLRERAVSWWLLQHEALQQASYRYLYLIERLLQARTLRGLWVHFNDLRAETLALAGAVHAAAGVEVMGLDRLRGEDKQAEEVRYRQELASHGVPIAPAPFGEAKPSEEVTELTKRRYRRLSLEPYQLSREIGDFILDIDVKMSYQLARLLYSRLRPVIGQQKLVRESGSQVWIKGLSYKEVSYKLYSMVRFYQYSWAFLDLLERFSASWNDEQIERAERSISSDGSKIGLIIGVLFDLEDWFALGEHLRKEARRCWRVGIEECYWVLEEAQVQSREVSFDEPKRLRFTAWLEDKRWLPTLYPAAIAEMERVCRCYRRVFEGFLNRPGGSIEGDVILFSYLYSLCFALGSIGIRFHP